jgi:superoxide reductase
MSDFSIGRRAFLEQAVAAAACFTVPGWLVGCGEEDPQGAKTVEAWERRARELESKGTVLTGAAPGKWLGKEGTHVPRATFNADGTVTITTPHPMTAEHWISTHYIKDQDGIVVGLQELTSSRPEAKSVFKVPAGTTKVVAYSYCNLHDHWQGSETPAP